MKIKIFTLAFLLSMIAITGTWAQNLPANLWTSPQSTTTEGRYRSNADDFIRPDSYTGVKFDKWFGLVSFLQDENNSMVATAGFATKISAVYIGAFYSGNMWAGAPVNNYTEQVPATTPNGGTPGNAYNVYNNINVGGASNPVNNAAVLIGLANMGFRLTYRTNYQSFNEGNIVTGNQLYDAYQTERGYLAPQIAWAMAKDLMTGKGIRPYVTVDVVFDRDYQKTETAGPDSSGVSGAKIGRSLNHIDPSLGAGLGGFTFYNKDGFKASVDLDYVLTMSFYDNEYSYEDGGVYKTGTIKGTYSPGSNPLIEQSYMSNLITPSISGSWGQDKLGLKFKLNFPVTISSREQNSKSPSGDSLIDTGASISTFTFIFRPDLRLALQYKAVPDKLVLNTGARIQATAITVDTIDTDLYDNAGAKISSETAHNKSFLNPATGTQFVSRFHIGATFNFTENAWVEAATGVSNAYGDGAIDVFAPGGMFSFGSILVVLKF